MQRAQRCYRYKFYHTAQTQGSQRPLGKLPGGFSRNDVRWLDPFFDLQQPSYRTRFLAAQYSVQHSGWGDLLHLALHSPNLHSC